MCLVHWTTRQYCVLPLHIKNQTPTAVLVRCTLCSLIYIANCIRPDSRSDHCFEFDVVCVHVQRERKRQKASTSSFLFLASEFRVQARHLVHTWFCSSADCMTTTMLIIWIIDPSLLAAGHVIPYLFYDLPCAGDQCGRALWLSLDVSRLICTCTCNLCCGRSERLFATHAKSDTI
jgi:hypothetical protein